MTSSDKPERSASDPGQGSEPASVITQTVEDSASETPASTTGEDQEPGATATDPGADEEQPEGSHEQSESQSGEVRGGAETPPPWQRGSAAATQVTSAEAEHAENSESSEHPVPREEVEESAAGASELGASASEAPEADTQKMEHPLRGLGGMRQGASTAAGRAASTDAPTARMSTAATRGTAAGGDGGNASATGRTTVSFGGGSLGRSAGGTGASTSRRPSRGPRRASLQVKRVDPWSVLKLALVLSIALFFVWMIAVAVLYGVLDGMGVWDQLNGTFTELTQADKAASEPLISAGRVFGVAAAIGLINVVLLTALATVAAFIYNVASDFAGGVEVTLSERE